MIASASADAHRPGPPGRIEVKVVVDPVAVAVYSDQGDTLDPGPLGRPRYLAPLGADHVEPLPDDTGHVRRCIHGPDVSDSRVRECAWNEGVTLGH